jgi:hypothetical protein
MLKHAYCSINWPQVQCEYVDNTHYLDFIFVMAMIIFAGYVVYNIFNQD